MVLQDYEYSPCLLQVDEHPADESAHGRRFSTWRTWPLLVGLALCAPLTAGAIACYLTQATFKLEPRRVHSRPRELLDTPEPPPIWAPNMDGPPVDVKVLTYNLFWWNLFDQRGGAGGIAGKLIAGSSSPPYDFMGFQECRDPNRVLSDGSLLGEFTPVVGAHGLAMAFRHTAWSMLAAGMADVAEDIRGATYYGRRGAQWMRLVHRVSGRTVLFLNHHGPLPIGTGGAWGPLTTARKILQLAMQNGQPGDAVMLVGDFNAGGGSVTLQELRTHLSHVYSGRFGGGIDNIFSNVRGNVISVQNLGTGGSDHDALSAVIQFGPPLRQQRPPSAPTATPPPMPPKPPTSLHPPPAAAEKQSPVVPPTAPLRPPPAVMQQPPEVPPTPRPAPPPAAPAVARAAPVVAHPPVATTATATETIFRATR